MKRPLECVRILRAVFFTIILSKKRSEKILSDSLFLVAINNPVTIVKHVAKPISKFLSPVFLLFSLPFGLSLATLLRKRRTKGFRRIYDSCNKVVQQWDRRIEGDRD